MANILPPGLLGRSNWWQYLGEEKDTTSEDYPTPSDGPTSIRVRDITRKLVYIVPKQYQRRCAVPNPSGAASPVTGVPTPNPSDDPAAKDDVDNTTQQLIIDEMKEVREKLSQMMGEEMKEMRGRPVVLTVSESTPSIEERDRRDEQRKLRGREAQLEKELRNYRLDPVTFQSY